MTDSSITLEEVQGLSLDDASSLYSGESQVSVDAHALQLLAESSRDDISFHMAAAAGSFELGVEALVWIAAWARRHHEEFIWELASSNLRAPLELSHSAPISVYTLVTLDGYVSKHSAEYGVSWTDDQIGQLRGIAFQSADAAEEGDELAASLTIGEVARNLTGYPHL